MSILNNIHTIPNIHNWDLQFEVYSETCKDSTPIFQRSQLSLLVYKIKHKEINQVYVESFDRFSRSFEILSYMRDTAILAGIPVINVNNFKDLRNFTDEELNLYCNFLQEEKHLLILKLKSLKAVNKEKKIYTPGRIGKHVLNFKNASFTGLWTSPQSPQRGYNLGARTLREIQSVLFNFGYKTETGKPLSLSTVSRLKKYYLKNILQ